MSFKYNAVTLKKLEGIFEEARFIVRYEKGSFNAGHCLLEDKRVVVINKFYSLEAKINALVEILGQVDLSNISLSEDLNLFYDKVKQTTLSLE